MWWSRKAAFQGIRLMTSKVVMVKQTLTLLFGFTEGDILMSWGNICWV